MLDIISSKILPNSKWSVTVNWKCIVEQSHSFLWRDQYVCPSWPTDIFCLFHIEPSIYEIQTLSLSVFKGLLIHPGTKIMLYTVAFVLVSAGGKNPYNSSYQHYFKKIRERQRCLWSLLNGKLLSQQSELRTDANQMLTFMKHTITHYYERSVTKSWGD